MLEAIFASLISFVVITIATYLLKINAKVAKASRLEEINSAITPLKKQLRDLEITVVKLETQLKCYSNCNVKEIAEKEVD